MTVMKQECVNVPFEYNVSVCHPEKRTQTIKVCSYENQTRTCTQRVCEYKCETRSRTYNVTECKIEQRTREVPYTVCVCQTRTRQQQVTEYKQVAVQKVENYTVMVPHEMEKDVQVCVCKMVAQTVTVPAATCCTNSCDNRATACCGRRARRCCL